MRVFLADAAVLVVAVAILASSPVTVSHPPAADEIAVLIVGVMTLLMVNLLVFKRAFAPVERLTDLMRTVDLLEPGRRIPEHDEHDEVAELTKAFNEMLERLERERRMSAHRALSAQEGERRRVAQELHDEVGQSLTAVLLQIERGMQQSIPDELRQHLIEARELARSSLDEVRQIVKRLRPEALDELGLENALSALAKRVSDQGGLRVRCDVDGRLSMVGLEEELVIYRVAQESLTNVLRHSGASEATLAVDVDPAGITMRVLDDGEGLNGAHPGAGILGMRERALLVGGRVEVGSGRCGGTEVRLEIPAGR